MPAQLPLSPRRKRQIVADRPESGGPDDPTYHRAAQACSLSAITSDSCVPAVAQPTPVSPAEILVGHGLYTDSAGRLWTLHKSSWWGVCMTAPVHFPGNATCTRMNMAAYGNLLLASGGHGHMSLPAADSGKPGHAQARQYNLHTYPMLQYHTAVQRPANARNKTACLCELFD